MSVLVAIAAAVLVGAGCSPVPQATQPGVPSASISAATSSSPAGEPTFSGPWADEFEAAYKSAKTDLQRRVLADGRITAQEMSALQDALRSCLEQAGYTGVAFADDGGLSFTVPEGTTPAQQETTLSRCEAESWADLDLLYFGMQRKPSNDDEATAMAACLVRVGLVPFGYTRQDYLDDSADHSFPFDSSSDKFIQCNRDPVNAGK